MKLVEEALEFHSDNYKRLLTLAPDRLAVGLGTMVEGMLEELEEGGDPRDTMEMHVERIRAFTDDEMEVTDDEG